MLFVFFFNHKPAYEMRISDWSSDVCSSDLLGGKRRGLARAFETCTTRCRPRQGVALAIGDGDDRVVEGRVNVRNAVRHALLDFFAYARCAAVGSFRHLLFLDYFFREAAARRGPLRVRALDRKSVV